VPKLTTISTDIKIPGAIPPFPIFKYIYLYSYLGGETGGKETTEET